MKNLSGLLLFGILTFFGPALYAQGIDTTAFNSDNRELLLKEIETVLSEFKREDCEKTIQELKKSIKQGKFAEKHYDGFLKITDIIVKRKMKRYNYVQPLLNLFIDFAQNTNVVLCDDAPVMKVSASFIRQAIKDNKDVRYLLTEPVHKYIDEMNFYR